jgi:hypothetical protein
MALGGRGCLLLVAGEFPSSGACVHALHDPPEPAPSQSARQTPLKRVWRHDQ